MPKSWKTLNSHCAPDGRNYRNLELITKMRMKTDPYCQEYKSSPATLVSSSVTFMGIFPFTALNSAFQRCCQFLGRRTCVVCHQPNLDRDFWPFELKIGALVTPALGSAPCIPNFGFSKPFCFRLRCPCRKYDGRARPVMWPHDECTFHHSLECSETQYILDHVETCLLRATAGTAIARLSHRNSVCPSVCTSFCHAGGSGQKGAS